VADQTIVSVLVPVAVAAPYTYRAPAGTGPGDIVEVPLGTRNVAGVVWDDPPDGNIGHNRLRDITRRFDVPPLNDEIRAFVDWVANYNLTTRGMVLRAVLRSPQSLEPEKPLSGVRLAGPPPERLTPARRRVLEQVEGGLGWSKSGLAAAAGVSSGVIKGLLDARTLETVLLPRPPLVAAPDPDFHQPELAGDQKRAAERLQAAVDHGGASVALLDGVTGSGKTEVYFEAIAEALRHDLQVLILVPEISLTHDFLTRFGERFGAPPAEWHSDVSPATRARVWRGVANGSVQATVGARSALYLPFRRLGLIVVDEEHDLAYKQQDRGVYSARDMAVVRGHVGEFPVVLSSATPSLESRVNANAGRYAHLVLTSRYKAAPLPAIQTIDLRHDRPERGSFLAPPLVKAMAQTLADGQQSLLFLNRRGYAPLTLCRSCGHRFQCPNCSTWLVEHRFRGMLQCHHCDHGERTPQSCPECGDTHSLVPCGPGVERLAEEAATRFPHARLIVLSSDLAGGVSRLRMELESIAAGEVDIIIGTQLIAKGHNFPFLSLVGVVDADLGLAHGDLRASERTFQLLSQVTGRAGRAGGSSRAFLQTYTPEHPVMQALVSGDREAFYEKEIAARQAAGLPPFGRLAAVIIAGPDRASAQGYAAAFRRAAPDHETIEVLGPAEAPIAVLRGRHRFRLLVRAPRQANLQDFLRAWQASAPRPTGSVRLHFDIDPQSFL
jgi:primosomal protein N' (replication factor Y)